MEAEVEQLKLVNKNALKCFSIIAKISEDTRRKEGHPNLIEVGAKYFIDPDFINGLDSESRKEYNKRLELFKNYEVKNGH